MLSVELDQLLCEMNICICVIVLYIIYFFVIASMRWIGCTRRYYFVVLSRRKFDPFV